MADRYVLILAGGRGTRFWPLSRRNLPKQCLSIDGGPTLIQQTVRRLAPDFGPDEVLILTGPDMVVPIRAQLPELPPENILVEPSGRNTLPCAIWGLAEVRRRGGKAMAVLPSDHHIADTVGFRSLLHDAFAAAGPRSLVTLGIRPSRAETGFGWIEPSATGRTVGHSWVRPVHRFVEKPPHATANAMLAAGHFLWNAGMFVWQVDAFEAALLAFGLIERDHLAELGPDTLHRLWPRLPATSIDYGVMERAAEDPSFEVLTLPADIGWSDLGSWPALAEVLPAESWGVGPAGAVVAVRSSENIVHAPGRLVALLGVDGLITVDTGDVLLIARREDAQDVRELLAALESRGLSRYT